MLVLRHRWPKMAQLMMSSEANLRVHSVKISPGRATQFGFGNVMPSYLYCIRSVTTESNPTIVQPVSKSSSSALRVKKISNAMKAYLERARGHEKFVTKKSAEFEIGKQHLANMMGLEAASMTQDDIDKAIRYLFPSGLYEPKARPMMKPPIELFPKEKAAQFDDSGRPFNTFFYTARANYYQMMYNCVEKFNELDLLEDKMIRKGISEVPKEKMLDLGGSEWISLEHARQRFLEKLTDVEYDFLITTFTRLSEHPYSFRCKDFIWQLRNDFPDVSNLEEVPELVMDENNRPYSEHNGIKFTANVFARVTGQGTGNISINGKDIGYFKDLKERQQLMFPLELSELLGKVDIEAKAKGGGPSSQANAMRYAIAMCLRSFVSEDVREKLRLAGLLTRDRRGREREKPGQKGPRAKYKWRKR